jgi:hypothetical protein
MKIKQLMLAPVALGMIAPVAANAADFNLAAVNQYSSSDQVTSVSQLSDVKPTDWAYQALGNLVERYGCVAGYPNGTFGGTKSMTRFEAAALLNSCLERVTEVTDELKRLLTEFDTELTVLTARVDGLEKKVGKLQASQFSTTTKLKGEASFILGGVPGYTTAAGANAGNTAFNYDLRLNLDTSFTGKDLLRTRLRSGNFSSQPFGSSSSILKLDKAETSTAGSSNIWVDRLYYTFPVGKNVKLTAGALVRNTEMAWIPSAYKSDILDFFQTGGASGVYNKATGSGFGAQYTQPGTQGLVANLNYVAENGNDSSTGVFDSSGKLNLLAQVGYRAPQFGVAVGYRYGTEGSRVRNFNALGGGSAALVDGQDSSSVAFNAYWQPKTSGIVPSISFGYGYNGVNGAGKTTGATNSQSWMAGLQWADVFAKGNAAGVAVGQPSNTENATKATMLEVFYKYRVSDNISITPAVFYASANQGTQNDTSNWGGVIQTKFTF